MSFPELIYRIRKRTSVQVERLRRDSGYGISTERSALKEGQEVADPAVTHQLQQNIRRLFSWEHEKTLSLEFHKNVMIGQKKQDSSHIEFPLFALHINLIDQDVDWHRDPKTGRHWPLVNSDTINIRDAQSIGEVDYVWRLNRCQHIVELAKRAYLTDDLFLRDLAVRHIKSWIDANPYNMGVNWTSSMEVSIRCISWILAISYLIQDDLLPLNIASSVYQSLAKQMNYVFDNLSRYSSANNHLIAELTGLITLGVVFGEQDNGPKWREKGIRELMQELNRQIWPDGVNKEQSIHYHSLVLDCLFWLIVLFRRAHLDIPEILLTCSERMCDFLAGIMDISSNIPSIGDSDDGWVIWLAEMSRLNNYRSQIATGAVLFNRPDFKALAKEFDEKSLWLLGAEGHKSFETLGNTSTDRVSLSFPDSGYYVLGSGRNEAEKLLLFDCGPLGYPSTAAHGHADALSIWLSVGGHPVLIDSGTYSYLAHPEWRDYFRGSAAHNTVVVNGRDQSVAGGPYIWINHAHGRCDTWYTSSSFDYVAGSHDGYYKRHKLTHKRRILFVKPDYWIIEDLLDSTKPFDVQAFWHFSPGEATLKAADAYHLCQFIDQSGNSGLQVIIPDRAGLRNRIITGDESTMQGWFSIKYGVKRKNSVLSITAKSNGKYLISHILIPTANESSGNFHGGVNSDYALSSSSQPESQSITLSSDINRDDIFFLSHPATGLKIGELKLHGQTILIRSDQLGIIKSVFVIGPLWAEWKGKTIELPLVQKPFCVLHASKDCLSMLELGVNDRLPSMMASEVILDSQ
jgi:hypothetical protein